MWLNAERRLVDGDLPHQRESWAALSIESTLQVDTDAAAVGDFLLER
jgi:hypothetical protein